MYSRPLQASITRYQKPEFTGIPFCVSVKNDVAVTGDTIPFEVIL